MLLFLCVYVGLPINTAAKSYYNIKNKDIFLNRGEKQERLTYWSNIRIVIINVMRN